MKKFFYGIIYFLIIIEPLTGGHIANFVTLPFAIAFLIFLAQTKKENQYMHYILVVFILAFISGLFFWKSVIFFILYYLINILNRKLPLEYLLKDFVMVFIVNLVFILLVNLTYVSLWNYMSLTWLIAIGVQTIYSLIYLVILKKSEGLMKNKYEKTNGY